VGDKLMEMTIFYFTGTGNSYYIAKKIADSKNALLVPVAQVINQEEIKVNTPKVGVVFPVYYMDAPNIIKEFAEKIILDKDQYFFAICNYGGAMGDAFISINKRLKNKRKIDASFGIQMPQNAFLKKNEDKTKLIDISKKRINKILQIIDKNKKGHYSSNFLMDFFIKSMMPFFRKLVRNFFIEKNDENREKTNEELLYKLDKYFKTNNDCNGCGLCLMVCPVNNIKIINKKPEWQSHCENCTACYNFCPNKAISNRISKNGYRYLMNGYSTVDAKKQCKIV
jgi:ferredoxin